MGKYLYIVYHKELTFRIKKYNNIKRQMARLKNSYSIANGQWAPVSVCQGAVDQKHNEATPQTLHWRDNTKQLV